MITDNLYLNIDYDCCYFISNCHCIFKCTYYINCKLYNDLDVLYPRIAQLPVNKQMELTFSLCQTPDLNNALT